MGKEFDIQILLARMGSRLHPITNSKISKSLIPLTESEDAAIDIITTEMQKLNTGRIVYELGANKRKNGLLIYKHLERKGYPLECLIEPENTQIGNAGAIKLLIELSPSKKPILTLCGDMIYDWEKMRPFQNYHKNGTISWFTSSVKQPIMEKYFGLVSTKDGEVVGDTKLNWNEPTDGYQF